MFISSSKTRETRKNLEGIRLEELKGRDLLRNFLERELKDLTRLSSANAVITASQKPDSNIYKFAKLLDGNSNMDLFKTAIKLQAQSLGTNEEKGLFNKLIFPIKDNWLSSKSKIKAFLLAKEGSLITDVEDPEKVVGDIDRQSGRMKNADIVEKLKSKRLSSVLKVFIALVMWNYIVAAEEEAARRADEEAAARKAAEEAAEEEAARRADEEAAARKAAEEEAARKAAEAAARKAAEDKAVVETAKQQGIFKKIESYPDKRFVDAFHNMMADDKYDKKEIIGSFEKNVDMFAEFKVCFEKYKKDHKFVSLHRMIEVLNYNGESVRFLFEHEGGDVGVKKFAEAEYRYRHLEIFLGQAGVGSYGDRMYEYPTHNMLERLTKCLERLKVDFGSIKTHPILKDLAGVYFGFVSQMYDELDDQLRKTPAKTDEQKAEKLREILESHPEGERFIPYAPKGKYSKVLPSTKEGAPLYWDRTSKMKVLLKDVSYNSRSYITGLVRDRRTGLGGKHIPRVDCYFEGHDKLIFVIEYVSGALPINVYAKTIRNSREKLLDLCNQLLEGSKEAQELKCFPKSDYKCFLVDKNGIVKFVGIDKGGELDLSWVESLIREILEQQPSILEEYHKKCMESKVALGLEDMHNIIKEMMKSS